MRDRTKKSKTAHALIASFFITALFSSAVLFCWGCGEKTEDGLQEMELSDAEQDRNEAASDTEENAEEEADTVFVYVCGAVGAPGVYELKKDARVFEAIEMAGGFTDEASAESVNQARTVTDGEQIYIPTVEEAKTQDIGVGESIVIGGTDKKININTAGKEELMTLTGIGEAKAQSILNYREEHGKFTSVEDLMKIEGIKEGVFNKIKDDITV